MAELRDLLPLGAVPETGDVAVTGITHDSRLVRPGDLYAALPGEKTHGARFAASAISAGAAAVLTDEQGVQLLAGTETLPAGVASAPVPVISLDHVRSWLGAVSSAIYGHPARELLMLGVTGTNGKTTTAYLLESGLRHAGMATGLIGTVETRVGDEVVASVRTTPEATEVHALLASMLERGVRACVMEVSSHALAYGRVDGVSFDVAGFTNLSQDHLDFHADLDEYFATKARLFTPRYARRGVVCVDGDYGRRLAERASIPTVTVAASDPVEHPRASHSGSEPGRFPRDRPAAWRVRRSGTQLYLATPDGREVTLVVPLPGGFNISNAALAVAMLAESGMEPAIAAAGVAACAGVPGRMEQVNEPGDTPRAIVDYAHTPDAVQNVLEALRDEMRDQHGHGRLIAVLGAGGDRDCDKRPLMGAAAARYANIVVVTDDNPRSEDPAVIRAAVLAGAEEVRQEERAEVIEAGDRRAAIRTALSLARGAADTVVVLGKGHEQGQEIAGTVEPFDDREVLREHLRDWNAEHR
ncbi:UDP-N-acetylmuramoyl-L-alanyl-D-glutamate--2,6-diaminopimelate ligase [Phytoactinopolyspora alkaliphila]|uniref:UDP-N-acetylmuramoyl-L-alanyl-D-glutamate--2,6-diaminopimelate ligase n=1 Tax=Phytoactinopolyspora alkaliphila TaxID=1783498 RepID=A0A6N9YFX9_9ACTN|nr:UDP-N-acetylmuramoyl-L-alanyl-D-glutamate--2,6-diaminopimelate ligase [Phytoactinopolyspora alkaliphila]